MKELGQEGKLRTFSVKLFSLHINCPVSFQNQVLVSILDWTLNIFTKPGEITIRGIKLGITTIFHFWLEKEQFWNSTHFYIPQEEGYVRKILKSLMLAAQQKDQ